MQYGCDHQLPSRKSTAAEPGRTPARTLVMSKTLIPANGSVGETAGAAVARPRHVGHIEPLTPTGGRMDLEERIRVLKLAMLPLNNLIPIQK